MLIFGMTTAASESDDMKQWQHHWRFRERVAIRKLRKLRNPDRDQLDRHLSIDPKAAGHHDNARSGREALP
jgi:hypothetical protein